MSLLAMTDAALSRANAWGEKLQRQVLHWKAKHDSVQQDFIEHMKINREEQCHNYGCVNEPGPLKPLMTKEGDIGGWVCAGECLIWDDPGA